MWNKRVGSSAAPRVPVLPEPLIFITCLVLALSLCLGAQLGSRGVSNSQQIPKGVVTSGSGLEGDVPESDQVVLVSSSPPPGRRAEKLEQPALICPKDPAQGGSCHGNTGWLPVPLLAIRAASLG